MTDYTIRKNHGYGVIAVKGRAHCQRQLAFFVVSSVHNVLISHRDVNLLIGLR